jgi:hypothetical protein
MQIVEINEHSDKTKQSGPAKHSPPMTATDEGMEIVESDGQIWNDFAPMATT